MRCWTVELPGKVQTELHRGSCEGYGLQVSLLGPSVVLVPVFLSSRGTCSPRPLALLCDFAAYENFYKHEAGMQWHICFSRCFFQRWYGRNELLILASFSRGVGYAVGKRVSPGGPAAPAPRLGREWARGWLLDAGQEQARRVGAVSEGG